MRRRSVLQGLLGLVGALGGFRLPLVQAQEHTGRVFVFVQADGGWDPTSFCDPKENTPGEPVINHWAEQARTRQAGSIPYAPFADNVAFFSKYYSRMLVINGVDAQTNSHTTGIVHNWSGRTSEGYPSMTALLAAAYGGNLPAAYLSFGGFAYPAGVARPTRLDSPDRIRAIASPADSQTETPYFNAADWQALEDYSHVTAGRLTVAPGLLPSERERRRGYQSALMSEGLQEFAAAVPQNYRGSPLRLQVELAVLAFKTRVAVSADLWVPGFDTHASHDDRSRPLLTELTQAVDYLWDFAERHEIADRLFVVIGSDFGRTNAYNAEDGKDHWPIGSYVIMEKNQPWTNRAVGETDALHFAQRVSPTTLERDDARGTIIYPKHVHKALRRYLGVDDSPGALRYPFNNTEDFAFFG